LKARSSASTHQPKNSFTTLILGSTPCDRHSGNSSSSNNDETLKDETLQDAGSKAWMGWIGERRRLLLLAGQVYIAGADHISGVLHTCASLHVGMGCMPRLE
jgi:hypothetical protein